MPASPLSGSASARTIFTPLYCPGLCDAVICAPPSSPSCTTPKYIWSVPSMPKSTTSAPWVSAPSMNASVSAGDETRMSRDTPIVFAFR